MILLWGFASGTPRKSCTYWGIREHELTEMLILLWNFATGTREKFCTYSVDSITGAHPDTHFAMEFRYRNPREILYLRGGFCNRSPPRDSFCYGISLQEPKRNLVLTKGFYDKSPPKY